MAQPLLEAPDRPDEAVRLRREIAGLEQELSAARAEAANAKQLSADATQAIAALRKQLQPLYGALKMVFGEISRVESAEMHDAKGSDHSSPSSDPRWDSWKSKLGGRAAEFIELLLAHREMNARQLAAAAKCDPRTVHRTIFVLNKADLIQKNGGKFSLKEL